MFFFVVFLEKIYSVSHKLITELFLEFILLAAAREGFFFTCLHEFHEIKLNVMKHALNCVS